MQQNATSTFALFSRVVEARKSNSVENIEDSAAESMACLGPNADTKRASDHGYMFVIPYEFKLLNTAFFAVYLFIARACLGKSAKVEVTKCGARRTVTLRP